MTKAEYIAVAAAAAAFAVSASAQEIINPTRIIEDFEYGVMNVCAPAQRAGMTTGEYADANMSNLTLQRMRVTNSTRVQGWYVRPGSDVAVMDRGEGCVVSASFYEDQRDKVVPAIRSMLTEGSSAYEVLEGDPDDARAGVLVAFCRPTSIGHVDSLLLREWLGEPRAVAGQRRRERQQYISIVVPQQPFCPQPTAAE